MRGMKSAVVSMLCGLALASAALAQSAPSRPAAVRQAPARQQAPAAQPPAAAPAPDDQEPPLQSDGGGAGFLPGAQFQRKLDGGPGFVCRATNALRDQQCTASCRTDETADCVDADGSGTPTCTCTKG